MPLSDPLLWDRIADMALPNDRADRSFEAQLASREGISEGTAWLAVEEYRRFLYLAALGQGRMVPSEAVDLVWHLHLDHEAHYAEVLPRIVGRPIAHKPGRPKGHEADYQATRALYRAEFDTWPPGPYWGRQHRREDMKTVVLVSAAIVIFTVLANIDGTDMPDVIRLLSLGFIALFALPPLARLTGLRNPRPLRDGGSRTSRSSNSGGCGSGADCGCGGCGGD